MTPGLTSLLVYSAQALFVVAAATSVRPLAPPDRWSVGILAIVVGGVIARLRWVAVGLARLWHLRRTSTSATLE